MMFKTNWISTMVHLVARTSMVGTIPIIDACFIKNKPDQEFVKGVKRFLPYIYIL